MTAIADQNKKQSHWPGESDEAHPEVFNNPPPLPSQAKPGQLNKQQFDQFFKEGYVVVEDLFGEDDMQALEEARAQIKQMVDDLAQKLYQAGKIKRLYRGYGLFQRLTMIEKEFPGSTIILHKTGHLPVGFRSLWSHEKLLNITEQLLGTPDISGSPVWNIRPKTPKNLATIVPWHQDNSYFDDDSYNQMIVTAWIPLLEVSEMNGCMQVVKNGHKTGKMAKHQCCFGGSWYTMLEEEEMVKTLGVDLEKDVVTCPIPYGGVLLFSNVLPHRSLPNISNDIRWSLDLRWQKSETPSGLFGQKDSLPMRSSTETSDFNIEWEKFDAVDRHQKAFEAVGVEMDEFDTTIQGPWMHRWELVHMNDHTEAFHEFQKRLA